MGEVSYNSRNDVTYTIGSKTNSKLKSAVISKTKHYRRSYGNS